jgi:hypothetical protein
LQALRATAKRLQIKGWLRMTIETLQKQILMATTGKENKSFGKATANNNTRAETSLGRLSDKKSSEEENKDEKDEKWQQDEHDLITNVGGDRRTLAQFISSLTEQEHEQFQEFQKHLKSMTYDQSMCIIRFLTEHYRNAVTIARGSTCNADVAATSCDVTSNVRGGAALEEVANAAYNMSAVKIHYRQMPASSFAICNKFIVTQVKTLL